MSDELVNALIIVLVLLLSSAGAIGRALKKAAQNAAARPVRTLPAPAPGPLGPGRLGSEQTSRQQSALQPSAGQAGATAPHRRHHHAAASPPPPVPPVPHAVEYFASAIRRPIEMPAVARTAPSATGRMIRAAFADPSHARNAVILAEIFGPPAALR